MTEKIRQIKYSGIEAVPPIISKRIKTGDADQTVIDTKPATTIAGGFVPERTSKVAIFDAGLTEGGEHLLYAAIHRGQGALIRVVEESGPTAESARWLLGRNYNVHTLKEAYKAHRFVTNNGLRDKGLTADG